MLNEAATGLLSESWSVSDLRELRDSAPAKAYSEPLWQSMAEHGWVGIVVPEQLGGVGFDHVGLGQISQQIGQSLCVSPFFATAIVSVNLILQSASESQKQAWLPNIIAGNTTLALALDESRHFSPQHVEATVVKQADAYVLNGEKRFVIDAPCADQFIVVARDAGKMCLLLVDANSPGVTVERTTMVDSGNAGLVKLNNVSVSADRLLQGSDDIEAALARTLSIANIHLAAELLGISIEVMGRTKEYLQERKQFGVPIGMFQALQHRAAHLWSEIELGKSIVLAALQAIDANEGDLQVLASATKAKLCEIAELATNEGIQMHGGIGMTDEFDIGFFIKRARTAQTLFGGRSYHLNQFAKSNKY